MKKYILILCSVLMIIGTSLAVSAAEIEFPTPYPIMEEYSTHNLNYAFIYRYKSGGTYLYYLQLTENRPYYSNANVSVDDGKYTSFTFSNNEWNYYGHISSNANIDIPSNDIVWTSTDIESKSGGLYFAHDPNFFPMPLHQMILEVAGESLTVELPKMGGTMKILAVCGVGLMALLISLPLFGKVLSRFLN